MAQVVESPWSRKERPSLSPLLWRPHKPTSRPWDCRRQGQKDEEKKEEEGGGERGRWREREREREGEGEGEGGGGRGRGRWREREVEGEGGYNTCILVIIPSSFKCRSSEVIFRLKRRYLMASERGSTLGWITSAPGASRKPSP